MIQSQYLLCAIPSELWDPDIQMQEPFSTLQELIQDTQAIERRLPKEVNLENERVRLTLCCNQIESIVSRFVQSYDSPTDFRRILQDRRFPMVAVDETYLQILVATLSCDTRKAQATQIGLGGSLYAPNGVLAHAQGFWELASELGWENASAVKTRLEFFRDLAGENKCGVIELQNPLSYRRCTVQEPLLRRATEYLRQAPLFSSAVVEEIVTGSRRTKMIQRLRAQIERGIKLQQAVNFSNQPHDIATEVLNEFVYARDDVSAASVGVLYADGSESDSFPVRCLPMYSKEKIRRLEALPPLRVALISMRHLELDRVVDMAWFRNREASQSRTLAEADHYCYDLSLKQFEDLLMLSRRNDGAHVHLYHTGFEPAVVAFYRAFVNCLRQLPDEDREILVVPYYYRGQRPYERGNPWL